ncbi:cell division control protein 6-like protein [Halorubrum ezzemoulense]|uniref:cell division control protein 6-like protein n=1 Tax=Halorubrum ezzemoulense TaxID=337243 RepID=UPI002330D5DE|nr:cell division control protein 6-like protein [Halorubrum ezzemoulense]MDB2242973.1 cell division control protein 6-like protein [Halorubrum ezzemoulense]
MLGINTDDTVRQTLSLKVTDTPMETESSVSPSDAATLRTVLEYWANRAGVDEACDTSAIAKAAALAAQDMGNARQALDLLRVGAELAEQHGEAPVTDDHIEIARERVQHGRVATVIRGQTEHVYPRSDRDPPGGRRGPGTVDRDSANVRVGGGVAAVSPLSTLERIQDHLLDLHMLGFLRRHEQNKGLSGGQYYEYALDLDPAIVLETRTEIAEYTE